MSSTEVDAVPAAPDGNDGSATHREADEQVTTPPRAAAAGPVPVPLVLLDPGLPVPAYAHAGDAGADLSARVDVVLEPGERALVPTGVAVALPAGYVGLVHPRSGLAARSGVTVLNAPGTIDAGYRGEIAVVLVNTDRTRPVTISRGDRIAQLVVQAVATAQFDVVTALPEAARGEGGFGSTGGHASAGKDI